MSKLLSFSSTSSSLGRGLPGVPVLSVQIMHEPSNIPTRPLTRASKVTIPSPFLSKSRSRPRLAQWLPNEQEEPRTKGYKGIIGRQFTAGQFLRDRSQSHKMLKPQISLQPIVIKAKVTLSIHYWDFEVFERLDKRLSNDEVQYSTSVEHLA